MEILEFCTVYGFSGIYEGTRGFLRSLILGYLLDILWGGWEFLGIHAFVFCGLSHSQHFLQMRLVYFEDKEFSGQAQAQALAKFAALLQINPHEFS